MEIVSNKSYTITLNEKEASDLVTAIEIIYAVMSPGADLNKIQPILELKDEIVLAANRG